ncbi:type IV toxin-antitoxin system AbiEi family antitoxin domain-containing protein [Acidipropionibacterium virtanenii]|uniref:AbiEi antitoxin N-terminal domain-containing protein n=1 Tax=Acidipropionibacterium virtanenii TaxID=2057246 RepID=A0A344UWB1_9ACTN|nr:type IV toxin-antitoxin system AbiEi family antitoxin domain-containing protein [Acidipropionibacterium virtanenii]AXE39559.1 hypothetical protein JS278_02420 [Acidipropionibacterium virtanenii]
MKARTVVPAQLMSIARFQSGVVSRGQALEAGLTHTGIRGLVETGRWKHLARGIYSTGEIGWEQLLWAGVLIGGPGSTVGGLAAAHQLGISPQPETIDIWAPRAASYRRRAAPSPWDFHRGIRASRGNPPHLSVEETVLDLCAACGPDGITSWIGKAVGGWLTTPDRILAALDRTPNLRNRKLIRECLEVISDGSNSALEARYRRDVEQAHGLPTGRRQKSVSSGTASDVVYQEYGTISELDGKLGHRGDGEVRDAWRDSKHLLLGFVTLRFGWSDVAQRPCEVAARVADVLRMRGWDGLPQRCPDCLHIA